MDSLDLGTEDRMNPTTGINGNMFTINNSERFFALTTSSREYPPGNKSYPKDFHNLEKGSLVGCFVCYR